MGVYIKGMELPKDAERVIVIVDTKDGREACTFPKPKEDIVNIREPHGRLIDETKAMDILDEYRDRVHIGKIIYTLFFTEVIDCAKLVIKQFTPTVIEGSEE